MVAYRIESAANLERCEAVPAISTSSPWHWRPDHWSCQNNINLKPLDKGFERSRVSLAIQECFHEHRRLSLEVLMDLCSRLNGASSLAIFLGLLPAMFSQIYRSLYKPLAQ